MIGGGVATPPGAVESVATIGEAMVVDGIGSGASVGGSATSGSGSGSPATGNAVASRNPAANGNCEVKDKDSGLTDNKEKVESQVRREKGLCARDEDETSGPPAIGGVMLTRPWEPPPPTTSPNLARSHLQQLHHQHRQIHAAQHPQHHQPIGVPTVPQPNPLIDGW